MQSETIRDELLKIDRRGHVLVKSERREALLDEFERCGVSAAEYQTFAHWRQRRKNRQQAMAVKAAVPVPAPSTTPPPTSFGLGWRVPRSLRPAVQV